MKDDGAKEYATEGLDNPPLPPMQEAKRWAVSLAKAFWEMGKGILGVDR